MADRLPPLRISQAPRPASKPEEWRRNVDQWAQDYHFALREIEKYLSGLNLTVPETVTVEGGVQGPAGPPGPRGPQGVPGTNGENGKSIKGNDGLAGTNGRTWFTGSDAPAGSTLASMAAGDFYLDIGNTGLGNVYVKQSDGTPLLLLNIRGPQGPPGNSLTRSARIQQSAAQSLSPAAGSVVVNFGQLAWDTYNFTDANRNRLYLPTHLSRTNYYLIGVHIEFSSDTGGGREVFLEQLVDTNWTQILVGTSPAVNSSGKSTTVSFNTLFPVAPSSVPSVQCRVSALTFGSGSINIGVNSWFSADWRGYA